MSLSYWGTRCVYGIKFNSIAFSSLPTIRCVVISTGPAEVDGFERISSLQTSCSRYVHETHLYLSNTAVSTCRVWDISDMIRTTESANATMSILGFPLCLLMFGENYSLIRLITEQIVKMRKSPSPVQAIEQLRGPLNDISRLWRTFIRRALLITDHQYKNKFYEIFQFSKINCLIWRLHYYGMNSLQRSWFTGKQEVDIMVSWWYRRSYNCKLSLTPYNLVNSHVRFPFMLQVMSMYFLVIPKCCKHFLWWYLLSVYLCQYINCHVID